MSDFDEFLDIVGSEEGVDNDTIYVVDIESLRVISRTFAELLLGNGVIQKKTFRDLHVAKILRERREAAKAGEMEKSYCLDEATMKALNKLTNKDPLFSKAIRKASPGWFK
jgi:hypothetical protein